MRQKNSNIYLIVLVIALIGFATTACSAGEAQAQASIEMESPLQAAPLSCITPATPEQAATCDRLESQILAVTVRIEMHTWVTFGGHNKAITTNSHATIMEGKYLVTHNHFMYSLTDQVAEFGEQKGYTGISLRTSDGRLLLDNAPLSAFSIVYADSETLVLAFPDGNRKGLFENAGLPSALFSDLNAVAWNTSMEFAQIDWDGERARVDWAAIDNWDLANPTPQMQIDNFPAEGCSGGGVFWNGVHIGNNWAKNIEEDRSTGEITRRYSIIALNSDALVHLGK